MSEENKDFEVFDEHDIETNKVIAGLAYFIFFLPLIVCPNSKFGKFHANQGLILLITGVGGLVSIGIVGAIFGFISFILGLVVSLIYCAFGIVFFVFCILGLVNGINGKAKELPIIGKYRIIK